MSKKKLFLSFTYLLKAMKDDRISAEDLEGELFYFGCAREHLEEPYNENYVVKEVFRLRNSSEKSFAEYVYGVITAAAFLAEEEGRGVFRKGMRPCYEELNGLLQGNGINTSSVRDLEDDIRWDDGDVKKRYGGLAKLMMSSKSR